MFAATIETETVHDIYYISCASEQTKTAQSNIHQKNSW